MVTVDAPPNCVTFPFKSCQSEVYAGGMLKVVEPQAALWQGNVVAELSQTNNPAYPPGRVIAH